MARRARIVHFLQPGSGTNVPLCGGSCTATTAHAVNGTAICAECARLLTEAFQHAEAAKPRYLS